MREGRTSERRAGCGNARCSAARSGAARRERGTWRHLTNAAGYRTSSTAGKLDVICRRRQTYADILVFQRGSCAPTMQNLALPRTLLLYVAACLPACLSDGRAGWLAGLRA